MKAVFLSPGPFQCGNRVANLENALETKELELQTLLDLAAQKATLCKKVSRLPASFNALGRKLRKMLILAQDVRELTRSSTMTRARAKTLRR